MDISDGLVSFLHKKTTTLVKDLAREGVFSASEKAKIQRRVDGLKSNVYSAVSRELRSMANDFLKKSKESGGRKKRK